MHIVLYCSDKFAKRPFYLTLKEYIIIKGNLVVLVLLSLNAKFSILLKIIMKNILYFKLVIVFVIHNQSLVRHSKLIMKKSM